MYFVLFQQQVATIHGLYFVMALVNNVEHAFICQGIRAYVDAYGSMVPLSLESLMSTLLSEHCYYMYVSEYQSKFKIN